jgi:hypothetical protein
MRKTDPQPQIGLAKLQEVADLNVQIQREVSRDGTRIPATLLKLLSDLDWLVLNWKLPKPYDPAFGAERECKCGHPYYRHFDSYAENEPIGCKYCGCPAWEQP